MDRTADSHDLVDLTKLAVWCRHCDDFRSVARDDRIPNVLDCAACGRRIGHTQWTPPAGRFRRTVERARKAESRR